MLLLCGCEAKIQSKQKQYTASFISVFDTVTTVVGKAESEEDFQNDVTYVRRQLEYYHKLFDIYNEYENINNLKTVNEKASREPVAVDEIILDLLEDCKSYYKETDGRFNFAMGSVLALWHKAREDGLNDPLNAYLPDKTALAEAGRHMNPDDVIIDRESSTVFFKDEKLKIDVGGIAKGWAVERACKNAPRGLLISVGGNVYATGPKDENGSPWAVGIRSPESENDYLHILNVTGGSVVTSGSYQRAYVFDDKIYHHIIDPETLYPSENWSSVSIVCNDSGLSDVLSTALFVMDIEEGQRLLSKYDAEALWLDVEGNKYYSENFKEYIRS